MKESLRLIEDKEVALHVAYTEKPLRDLAAKAIDMGYYWAQPAYDAATSSAIRAGEDAEVLYRERRASRVRRDETILQLSEIDPGKEVSVARDDLVSYALSHGYTSTITYGAFNRIIENPRAFSEVNLLHAVPEDRESIILDNRVISLLRSILTPKQLELIEGFYGAS